MPTLKAIHICNYSRASRFFLEFVNFVSHQPPLQPKIAKEYVFANANRRTKKKYDCPTMAIRNAGESADIKVIILNKLTAKRKVKCLEIPHYA